MATRARKTILSNPLDELNPQIVSVKSTGTIHSTKRKKNTIKKIASSPVESVVKVSADAKVPENKVIPKTESIKKRVRIKRVNPSADAPNDPQVPDISAEHAEALSHFDALAEVVISHAAADSAVNKKQSKDDARSTERASQQGRAEDVFDAELSKEPPCALVRVKITSDRETRAMKIVKTWSQWSVAAGIVPVPLMDIALVSGIQVKMIYDLCQVYNIPFEKKSALAVASGLVGGSFSAGVARTIGEMALKSIPYVEQVLQPTLAFATTYSMGYVFVKHFENSGTLMNFDASKMNIYFHEQFEKSKKLFSRKQAVPA